MLTAPPSFFRPDPKPSPLLAPHEGRLTVPRLWPAALVAAVVKYVHNYALPNPDRVHHLSAFVVRESAATWKIRTTACSQHHDEACGFCAGEPLKDEGFPARAALAVIYATFCVSGSLRPHVDRGL